jgi:protein TonB
MKPGNHDVLKGCILALFIHGVLFFIGGRLFVKPVQYSVQSANGSIDVDLVTALPQPDLETVKSITPLVEKQQETVKIMPQEEPVALPPPDVDAVKSIASPTEKQPEAVKQPQPEVKSIASTMEKQQETVKAMPHPSQEMIRTKSKPGYFQNRPPKYPQLARQMHQEGLVMLMVEVDRKGMPVKVEVKQSSGYQLLDQAALEAVRHWRFEPERIGDIPIESRVTIPIRFRLEE